jgi:RimJ/RimL family protein N-acetyltransferase
VLNHPEGFVAAVLASSSVVLVVERCSDARPVGLVQAYALDPIDRHAAIAIAVEPGAQGAGWTMEAVALFADYLFSTLALHKLYFAMLETSPANSNRAGRWLEFEGCLREREYRDGQLRDLYIYAMYRSFWAETLRPAFIALARTRSERHARRNTDG